MILGAITWNLAFHGLVYGLVTALVAMGIVLVYRASRVINFSVGNLGVPATALFGVMAAKHGWPYWLALTGAIAIGILTGVLVELVVIRRLAKAPRVIVLVATIGVAQLLQAITLRLPDYRTGQFQTAFPTPFTVDWDVGWGVDIVTNELLVLIIVPIVTIALWWVLGHTVFGESVRAVATNADLARMTGISPKLVSTGVWALAGFLSTMAIFLTANLQASTELVEIGPVTLLRGMAAALLAGMVSFPRAAIAGVAVGMLDRLLYSQYLNDAGIAEFIVFLIVVVVVARVSRDTDRGGESFHFAPRVAAVPERLRRVWWVRWMPQLLGVAIVAVAVAAPFLSDVSGRHATWSRIIAFAICALSVTVLTGWAGQLSLGQMAFAGVGALAGAAFARGQTFDIGWRDVRIDGTLPTLTSPTTVLIGALVACGLAILLGLGALRVRGLLLAVSTLAFAIAAERYLWSQPFFEGDRSLVTFPRNDFLGIEFTQRNRAYYFFALAVLILTFAVLAHLRRSGIGRMIVGVRENPDAAAAMTVSPARMKLTAFGIAGFVAGLGGSLLAGVYPSFAPQERFFEIGDSITVLSIAVVGGLGSLSGAVFGALWIVGLPSFFLDNDTVPLFTSSIGMLLILLYLPGGFAQIGFWARDQLLAFVARRLPEEPAKTAARPAVFAYARRDDTAGTNADGLVLTTDMLTVRFGGLLAVDTVAVSARPGEVIGLIGNNGAGKSTLLNAIGGYVKATGTVELAGRDVSRMRPHQRARLGLGRTFQAASLYPELTVREAVLVATEARRPTSLVGTLLVVPERKPERARRAEAAELIDFLGLGRYADRYIAELSTGTRRIVELACVLGVGPRVLCLDEPTAGVAQREAEAFGPLVTSIQRELGATLVIVEHDLPMIMAISDRIYCLEAGKVIAEGPPGEIRTNPRVIASYLGTDERAILRSDAPA